MVSRINDPKVTEILKSLDDHAVTVVTGGAGAGKTHTMVNAIIKAHEKNKKICCITYTNAAANEIRKRLKDKKIYVSTIHEFLWNQIKLYPEVLLRELKRISQKEEIKLDDDINKVQYGEYRRIDKGIISHADIISFSKEIFLNYPLMGRILKDKYNCIFLDEYQDTYTDVLMMLFNVKKKYIKDFEIAMFGDRMQSIYDNLDFNIFFNQSFLIQRISIEDNRRNPEVIIKLANKIRDDGLQQKCTDDESAPNMVNGRVKRGIALFAYGGNIQNVTEQFPWIKESRSLKILSLTRKMIARQCGFISLLNVFDKYNFRDELFSNKFIDDDMSIYRDPLSGYLICIQHVIDLYKDKEIHDLISRIDFRILRNDDRRILRCKLDEMLKLSNKTIGEMISYVNKNGIIIKNERLLNFENDKPDFIKEVSKISYIEFSNVYKYLFKNTIFSTIHGVKGEEYDDVLLILDNGNWSKYDFDALLEFFSNPDYNNERIENAKHLFYVACTRARNSLIVYYPKKISCACLKGAINLFGVDSCIDIGGNDI